LLGIPAYLLVRRRWRAGWPSAAIGGFFIGAIPVSIGMLRWLGLDLAMPGIDGWTWWDHGLRGLGFGACGLIGGLVFGRIIDRAAPDEDGAA
jgi:hypothetical protein